MKTDLSNKLRVEAKGLNDFRVLLPDGSELEGVKRISFPFSLEKSDSRNGPLVAEMYIELDSFFSETWPQFNPDGLKHAAKRLGYRLIPEGVVEYDYKYGWVLCKK